MPNPRIQGYYGPAAPALAPEGVTTMSQTTRRLPATDNSVPTCGEPHGWDSFGAIQRAVIEHLDAHQRMAGAERYPYLSPDRGRPIKP